MPLSFDLQCMLSIKFLFPQVLFLMYVCLNVCVMRDGACGGQRCWSTGGCEPPAVGPGEPNSGPLKEQYVSLTAESSLSLKSNS